jgi:hypothetical protein
LLARGRGANAHDQPCPIRVSSIRGSVTMHAAAKQKWRTPCLKRIGDTPHILNHMPGSAYFFTRNMAFTTRINEVNMPSMKATRIMTSKVPKGINMILLL